MINQLLNFGIIHTGEEFEFMEATGILLRDTWIDCCFTSEKFPSLYSWCQAVGRAKVFENGN